MSAEVVERVGGQNKIWSRQIILYKLAGCRCLSGEIVNDQCHPNLSWCESLYEANARQLILYGRALGLSHSEAEDILQDTFVALISRGERPEQAEHYCIRSFRNRAFNYRRSLWRRMVREWESKRWFDPSPTETPQERAAMRALAALPIEQREVIVLKVWHQYTFDEIGGLVDASPNTVAGRYRYGLQKLRSSLSEDEYEQLEPGRKSITYLETAQPVSQA